jgi:hypothetical protein
MRRHSPSATALASFSVEAMCTILAIGQDSELYEQGLLVAFSHWVSQFDQTICRAFITILVA